MYQLDDCFCDENLGCNDTIFFWKRKMQKTICLKKIIYIQIFILILLIISNICAFEIENISKKEDFNYTKIQLFHLISTIFILISKIILIFQILFEKKDGIEKSLKCFTFQYFCTIIIYTINLILELVIIILYVNMFQNLSQNFKDESKNYFIVIPFFNAFDLIINFIFIFYYCRYHFSTKRLNVIDNLRERNQNNNRNIVINIIYNNNNNHNNLLTETEIINKEILIEKIINNCQRFTFKLNEKNINETCQICLNTYKENDNLLILPCFHKFHFSCIYKWIKIKTCCPLDMKNLENYLVNE